MVAEGSFAHLAVAVQDFLAWVSAVEAVGFALVGGDVGRDGDEYEFAGGGAALNPAGPGAGLNSQRSHFLFSVT